MKTYGGTTIAIRCASCTLILCEVGTCDGCGKVDKKLTVCVRGRKPRRYCTPDCKKATDAAKRKVAA